MCILRVNCFFFISVVWLSFEFSVFEMKSSLHYVNVLVNVVARVITTSLNPAEIRKIWKKSVGHKMCSVTFLLLHQYCNARKNQLHSECFASIPAVNGIAVSRDPILHSSVL